MEAHTYDGAAALREFANLKTREDDLTAQLAVVKERRKLLEPSVEEWFTQTGIQNTRVDGVTVYLHRELWASAIDGDKPRAVEALRACGLDEYITTGFHTGQLSALFREWDRDDVAPPEPLRGAINVAERISVRARKGN